jgi:phosphatidylserine decarboxylase
MNREHVVDLVKRLPQGTVSRAWGWLARRRAPTIGVRALQRTFVKMTGIDMEEAEKPLASYPTLEDLFVRRLRPGLRPICSDVDAVVSPVDGVVGQVGTVTDGTLLQAKGRHYALSRLLGDESAAATFSGGSYCTLYLSPRDYHRIHTPLAGEVREAVVIPGALMPVFLEALEQVDELFARNERLISYLDTDSGRLAIVKVGATMVGRISVTYDSTLRTNVRSQDVVRKAYENGHPLDKGAEIGAFELGSTVILVSESAGPRFENLREGDPVRMGQRIGTAQRKGGATRANAARGLPIG